MDLFSHFCVIDISRTDVAVGTAAWIDFNPSMDK